MKKINLSKIGSSQLKLQVVVSKTGKYNYQDCKDQKIISEQWFDTVSPTLEDYGCVCLNNKRNFIDSNGRYLFEQWFDEAGSFLDEFAKVGINNKWNLINKSGQLLNKRWFDDILPLFFGKYTDAKIGDKKVYVSIDGEIFHEKPSDYEE